MKHIENNIVEEFLKKHPQKNLSLIKIKRELKISKNNAFLFAMNSKNIRKVKPYEVGSGKHKLSVFTYNNVPDTTVYDVKEIDKKLDEEKIDEEKTDEEKIDEEKTDEEKMDEVVNKNDNIIDSN